MNNAGVLDPFGETSGGILAQSFGGEGGDSGCGDGAFGFGGASSGYGGEVQVTNSGAIQTATDHAQA